MWIVMLSISLPCSNPKGRLSWLPGFSYRNGGVFSAIAAVLFVIYSGFGQSMRVKSTLSVMKIWRIALILLVFSLAWGARGRVFESLRPDQLRIHKKGQR